MELLALVVAESDAAVVVTHYVVRIDGDFASSPRAIDDVLGNGIAGGVTPQAFDDADTFVDTGSQVRGAFDQIALIEVVGFDAAHEQFVHEVLLHFHAVVDSVE